jgi:hypothetical protein
MSGEAADNGHTRQPQRLPDDLVRVEPLVPADDHSNIVSILSFMQDVSVNQAEERLQPPRDALTSPQSTAAQRAARLRDRAQAATPRRRALHRPRPVQNVNDTLGHRSATSSSSPSARRSPPRSATPTFWRASAVTSSWSSS